MIQKKKRKGKHSGGNQGILTPVLRNIPKKLRKQKKWVVWKRETRGGGKPTKPPYNPKNGKLASVTNSDTWGTYDEAVEAYKSGGYQGIGYVLTAKDPIVGIDLDKCRNAKTGHIEPWAKDIILRFNSYTEASPSGTGIRIFVRGELPSGGRKKGQIEVYSTGRYLTVTGRRLRNYSDKIESRTKKLARFHKEIFDNQAGTGTKSNHHLRFDEDAEPDDRKLKHLFKKYPKAKKCWNDKRNDLPTPSERDLALANYATQAKWPDQEIADLLIACRRKNRDGLKRLDYYARTIEKAHSDSKGESNGAKSGVLKKPGNTEGGDVTPTPIEPIRLQDGKQIFNKWLYLEDDNVIDLIFGIVAGNLLPGDPSWLYLIGPPGDGKTELFRSIADLEDVFCISTLTPATLISGLVTEPEPSLLPKLDGKVLVIKDFTCILSMPRERRAELIGMLRDCYDGTCSKSFGTGATKKFKSRFNLIAAVTPSIEEHWGVHAQLGERFLQYRTETKKPQAKVRRALRNANREIQMRAELASAAAGMLANASNSVPDVPSSYEDKLIDLAMILATARSPVPRNGRNDEVKYLPQPETPTRVVKQLLRLGQGVAMLRRRRKLTEAEMTLTQKVALDSIPSKRRKLLEELFRRYKEKYIQTQVFADALNMPSGTVKLALEDLNILRMVKRRRQQGQFAWKMSGKFYRLLVRTGGVM